MYFPSQSNAWSLQQTPTGLKKAYFNVDSFRSEYQDNAIGSRIQVLHLEALHHKLLELLHQSTVIHEPKQVIQKASSLHPASSKDRCQLEILSDQTVAKLDPACRLDCWRLYNGFLCRETFPFGAVNLSEDGLCKFLRCPAHFVEMWQLRPCVPHPKRFRAFGNIL